MTVYFTFFQKLYVGAHKLPMRNENEQLLEHRVYTRPVDSLMGLGGGADINIYKQVI